MITKHPPVLSRAKTSLPLVRAPGAFEVVTLGADMSNVAAEVASAGEVDVGGVVMCRACVEVEVDAVFLIIELIVTADVVAGWLGLVTVGVALTIEGRVGNGAGVCVKDAGNTVTGSLVMGEVVEEVGLGCNKVTHYISVLQL